MSRPETLFVKICGLQSKADIEAASALDLDAIGFVFAPKSRRFVSFTQAKTLKEQLRKDIQAAGVFVNAPIQTIVQAASEKIIDLVQLHGSEDSEYIQSLKSVCSLPVIQAFRIESSADLVKARESTADRILLDAPAPGSGKAFDWSLLQDFDRDFILAGGLNPDLVEEALKLQKLTGLDVSSGVESDGKKDPEKMKAFVQAARRK